MRVRVLAPFRKMNINARIFWLLFISLLVSSAIIFQTSRAAVQKSIKDFMYNYVALNQEKAQINLESLIDQVSMLSVRLLTNNDIYDLLEDDRLGHAQKASAFVDIVDAMAIDRSVVGDVVLVTKDGSAYRLSDQRIDLPGQSYIQAIEQKKTPVWGGIEKDGGGNAYILLGRKYQNFFTGQNIGCLVVYIKERAIYEGLKDIIVPSKGFSFLAADDATVLSYPNPERVGATIFDRNLFGSASGINFKTVDFEGTPSIVTQYPLRGSLSKLGLNWIIVSVVSDRKLFENVGKINKYAMLIQFSVLLIAALISIYVSKGIIRPIQRLNRRITQFNGVRKILPSRSSRDELGILEDSFNDMVVRISELIERQNEEKDRQREMELNALQAQINPHFLYNTLDAIAWMAKIDKQKNIEEIVIALSHFYRLGLHKGDKYITVEEEVGIARNYIAIETMRTPGKFEVTYEIEAEILHFTILKMLLQPLIENALKHGIRGKRGKGNLVIKGYRSAGDLVFEIIDDGEGFEVGKWEKEDRPLRYNGGGYGIRNVNERIRLEYGDGYGVAIRSEIGQGTVSIVTVRTEAKR